MKQLSSALLIALIAAACGGETAKVVEAPGTQPAADHAPHAVAAVPVKAGWTATDGVAAPESIYVDPASGFIFSSQIVGQPADRDGNGRIAKLNGDGTMIKPDWVTGLNAPKGLRSHEGMLWTADLDELVGIDIATGEIKSRVKIDGAQFLNDIAIGADGTIYVTDMMASRIYAVQGGKPSVFTEGEAMEWPNGVLLDGDRLIVGGWGKPEADFTTKVPGRLFAIDLKTKQKTPITPKPFANIDGVESDGAGGYLVTDYLKGQLIRVNAKGATTVLKTFMPGTADIGVVPASKIVLVPHMNENKLAAYDLSNELK
jgi:hypothetical protein